MKALSHLRVGLVAGLLAFGSSVAPALAQNDEGDMSSLFAGDPIFRDGLKGFRSLDGQGFSLMRRGNETLFRFDDALEVWALESVPGPRGDEFLKNDVGRVFVRLTDLGGVILYDSKNPGGLPVDPIDNAQPINDPSFEAGLESNLTIYTSVRLGTPVSIRIEEANEPSSVWLQDAARVVAEGLIRSEKIAREKVEIVQVKLGNVPDITFEKPGTLTVLVNPADGYSGRPSTDRVVYLLKNLVGS